MFFGKTFGTEHAKTMSKKQRSTNDAPNDFINIFEDHLKQNNIFRNLPRGRVNMLSPNQVYTRFNPISIDLFGALWYWGGTMCPEILKPLSNLKFLSKSNQIKAES